MLVFGTYDSARHPRVRVILDGLSEEGLEVDECNVPLGISTAQRVRILTQPWRLPAFVLRLLACWAQLAVASTRFRRRHRPDVLLVGYLGHFDVLLARVLFPRTPIVLDHLIFAGNTASDRNVRRGLRSAMLDALDRWAIRAASLVLVDTDEHARMIPEGAKSKTVVVPVGADASWFEAGARTLGARETGDGKLSVIFYGLMTPLQGAEVIAEAIKLLDGAVDATIVGSGQDGHAVDVVLDSVPGVTRLTWVEPTALPTLVARHDVGIGIFGTSDKARRVVPNKVYQSLAAGLAVVTSDTPPQRRMLGGDAVLYSPPGDAEALADALRRLSGDRALLARLRAGAERTSAQFAARAVVAGLLERLNGELR